VSILSAVYEQLLRQFSFHIMIQSQTFSTEKLRKKTFTRLGEILIFNMFVVVVVVVV